MLISFIILVAACLPTAAAIALMGVSYFAIVVTAVTFLVAGMMLTVNGASILLKRKDMTNDKFAEFFDLDK